MRIESRLLLLFISGNIFKDGNCRSRHPVQGPVLSPPCSLECSDKPCWTNCARTPRKIRDKRRIRPTTPILPPPRNGMLHEGTKRSSTSFPVGNSPDTPIVTNGYIVTSTSSSWEPVNTQPSLSEDVYIASTEEYITSAPLPVENLTAVRVRDLGIVEVSWDPSRSSTQEGYKLSYYVAERQSGVPKSLIVNRTKVTLDDLLPGWNYSISVRVIANKSESTESTIYLVTQPATPTSLEVESVERGFIVSWKTNVKSKQEKFEITWIMTFLSDHSGIFHQSTFTTESHVSLTDVYPGVSYRIQVIAFSYGIKSRPVSQIQTVAPRPPRNVTIRMVWSNGVLVQWEEPQNSFFSEFAIHYKTIEDTTWRKLRRSKLSRDAEIDDLTPGELYIIRINTVSDLVESFESQRVSQTIPPKPVLEPTVKRISTNVAVEWLRPEGRIETYLIRWWQVKNSRDIHTKNVTENTVYAVDWKYACRMKRELIISDLKLGIEYSFSINAVSHNSVGSVAILQLTMEPTAGNGLNAVITRTDGNISDIYVTWDRPDSLPDFYIVNVTLNDPKSDDPPFHNVSGTTTETVFLDVEISEGFMVYVRAWALDVGGLIISKRFKSLPTSIRRIGTNPDVVIPLCLAGGIAAFIGIRIVAYGYFTVRRRNLQSQNQQSDEWEMSPERLTITRVLGNGAFGIVKLGSLRDDHGNLTNVAVKMLRDDSNENDSRNFLREIKLMKALDRHPNIVSLVGCCTIGQYPFLVVEYCSRGDLHSFLRKSLEEATSPVNEARKCTVISKKLPKRKEILKENCGKSSTSRIDDDYVEVSCSAEDQDINCHLDIVTVLDMLNFGRQIATGMVFLSSNRIVHRDLATRNVLVCYDRTLKISDFGMSRDIYQENVYKKSGNGRMPLKWMAIEALTHQVYSTYSDVWSFGILLWEIVTLGGVPYPGVSTMELLKKLQSGYRMERPENCSIPLYDVMLSCWQTRPRDRPTFTILRQELGKLISATTENEYLDLNDVSEQVAPEPSSLQLQNIV